MKSSPNHIRATAKTYLRFTAFFLLGVVSLLFVAGLGSFVMIEITAILVIMLWFLPSTFIAGFLANAQPGVNVFWNIGYSLPIVLWGAILLCNNPKQLGTPLWFSLSILALVSGFIGDRIGRRVLAYRHSNGSKKVSAPLEY
jgi:hypothetical protein